jgi:hypothetical protein
MVRAFVRPAEKIGTCTFAPTVNVGSIESKVLPIVP